jgi:uncharacterized caspase-like protein
MIASRMFGFLALALATLFAAAGQADARRIALVIGNDAYAELPALRKAGSDATDFAALLKEKSFDQVLLRHNLSSLDMEFALSEFLETIAPGDTALFFYSGHGWSDGSQNFLVGTDAPKSANGTALARISLSLQNGANGIIDAMAERGAALKVIVVDACRDNPFVSIVPGRSIGLGRGLARVEPPNGTFVVFSAGAGQVALDRLSDDDPDRNSVFTRTFLPLLRADAPLLDAVKTTQERVYELARLIRHEQEPAYYDQVRGDACLSETCRQVGAAPPEGAVVMGKDAEFWMVIRDSKDPADFASFQEAFPDSMLATTLARRRMQDLEADYWQAKQASERAADLEDYLKLYPEGAHASDARARLAALETPEQEAAVQPPAEEDAAMPELSGRELIAAVQEALKQAGCYAGKVDGVWGPRSQKALEALVKHREITAAAEPSAALLAEIADTGGRVCPAEMPPVKRTAVAPTPRKPAAAAVTPAPVAKPARPAPSVAASPPQAAQPPCKTQFDGTADFWNNRSMPSDRGC